MVGFILVRLGASSGHSSALLGSSDSFGFFTYIRVRAGGRWVHSGTPSGSFGFIPTRPGGRRVHSGSLCSFGRTLVVAPCVSLGSFDCTQGVARYILARPAGRWVHSGAIWVSSVSLGFIRARPWCRRVHFCLGGFLQARPGCRSAGVHLGSLGSFGCALGVVGFIHVRWVNSGAPWRSSGSFGFDGLIRARPGGRKLHSVAPFIH